MAYYTNNVKNEDLDFSKVCDNGISVVIKDKPFNQRCS